MIELSRHIESLLLKHDCVIVPGLGGFVTQYVPARRVADEQIFLPPCRSVGFNPELAINDGLLAQSYMHAYDSTYPESVKLIADAVAQLKAELTERGEYTLHGIGRLCLGIDGRYNFEPCEAGVISPELYGLDSLSIPVVSSDESEAEEHAASTTAKIKRLKPVVKRTERNYTISLNRELVNYVAAAVVAVLFYFIWATPVADSNLMESQQAAIICEQLFAPTAAKTQQAQQPATPAPVANAEQVAAPANEVPATSEASGANDKPEQATLANGRYTIVLASAIPQKNANELTEKLKTQGQAEAQTYVRGKMVRVVYGNYANREEAQQALRTMHAHSEFSQAWVMQVQ